jgi:hypothetical protein
MTVIEQFESEAALGLLAEGIPLQELAAENILLALQRGLLSTESARQERQVLEASIAAGRTALEHTGITIQG